MVIPYGRQSVDEDDVRAVAVGPRFLLLDEPAAGLDDRESMDLAESIAKLRDDVGCGVLLVEHDMRIIFRVCERIQVLDFGKPLGVGGHEIGDTLERGRAAQRAGMRPAFAE